MYLKFEVYIDYNNRSKLTLEFIFTVLYKLLVFQ